VSVRVDDWGVKRLDGTGEQVAWDDVVAIEIITTTDGSIGEDLFWLLFSKDGAGVAVTGEQAHGCDLVTTLQQRFPDLDNEAVIAASGSVEEARFTVWRRRND
jgi:hypothetical protein